MAFNNYGNRFQQTTPVILNLIIINVLVYVIQSISGGYSGASNSTNLFALHHYKSVYFRPYQVVTYMFMHANLLHVGFNMLALWMFGSLVEKAWGPKRFLVFYFICGLGAAFFQLGNYIHDFWAIDHSSFLDTSVASLNPQNEQFAATVGASGAIMGVVAAFGYLFPNMELIIIPLPVPIKAKWAVPGIILIDVFGGIVKVQNDNIAHFAHIGGALIGFLLVVYWNKTNKQTFY